MTWSGTKPVFLFVCLLLVCAAPVGATHVDITVQSIGNQIVTGAGTVSDDPGNATLGIDFQERVFGDNLGSNFRAVNPGFNSVATSNALLQPSGAEGFAEGTEIEFDLLPFTLGSMSTNLAYWDGIGAVDFGAPPADTTWTISVRQGFGRVDYTVAGDDTMVTGGSVGEVSDINRLHEHQRIEVETVGGGEPEGVYLVSMQMRVDGYETSEPIFLSHYSFNTPTAVGDLAQDWVRDNYSLLVGTPGDYNGDTLVTAADYAVWRDGAAPDTSLDGYDEWAAAFGAGVAPAVASAGTSVPEPVSLGMIAVASAVLALGRRQRSGP